jgi:hypothetical protein
MESAPVLVRHAGGVAALRQLPPGFRFRPTDEELVVQYLRRKAFGVPLPAAVIPVVRFLVFECLEIGQNLLSRFQDLFRADYTVQKNYL